MRKQPFHVKCRSCGETQIIYAFSNDVELWESGLNIQESMPYLTPGEREMLISGTCDNCWDKLFG